MFERSLGVESEDRVGMEEAKRRVEEIEIDQSRVLGNNTYL